MIDIIFNFEKVVSQSCDYMQVIVKSLFKKHPELNCFCIANLSTGIKLENINLYHLETIRNTVKDYDVSEMEKKIKQYEDKKEKLIKDIQNDNFNNSTSALKNLIYDKFHIIKENPHKLLGISKEIEDILEKDEIKFAFENSYKKFQFTIFSRENHIDS